MPRISPVTGKADVAPEYQAVVDQVLAVFGSVRGPFSILLHSPKLAERLLRLVTFNREESVVPGNLRSLAILATRALGLGTTLTTRHLLHENEAEAALGLPAGVHSYAILPIGYPMGNFGPVGRGRLADIVFQDKWGAPYPAMSQ